MKPLPRSPKDLGVPSEIKPEAAPLAMPNEEEVRQAWLRMSKPAERAGLDWKWIVLILAMFLLVAGLLAWRFGWLSGALPMHSSALLLTHRRTFLQRR